MSESSSKEGAESGCRVETEPQGRLECHSGGGSDVCLIPTGPKDSDNDEDLDIVGVLDASGSMSSVWPFVADSFNQIAAERDHVHLVTFSESGVRVDVHPSRPPLSRHLRDHGGGMTNIIDGIEKMKVVVRELRKAGRKRFLVVFVSDGADTLHSRSEFNAALARFPGEFSRKGIEFTTVGIGASFPTFVSMTLRNAFHHGRVNIPNVTLVDSTADYINRFEAVRAVLVPVREVTVDPPVQTGPWHEPAGSVFEGSWALVPTGCQQFNVGGRIFTLERQPWTYDTAEAVLQQWIRMLHAAELAGQQIRRQALTTLESAERIADALQGVLTPQQPDKGAAPNAITFYRRLKKKLNMEKHQLAGMLKELKLLAQGSALSTLSDQELGQRLAIGTIEGKHHNRALRWKGCSMEEFTEYKSKFIELYHKHVEGLRDGPDDENRSAISLESNRDVLLQPDLLAGIREVSSQYFLVECLPIVGVPLKIRVFDGSMINPWLVSVEHVARHTPFLDTVSLNELTNRESDIWSDGSAEAIVRGTTANLSVGGGEVELANAVCPVFSPDVCPTVGPFMRSGLYQMLMTHVVCKNIDTIDFNAHLALLAATLEHLLKSSESDSTWRKDMIQAILDTTRGVYFSRSSVQAFVTALKTSPALAMVTMHPDLPTTCESLSKAMLFAMCVKDELDQDQKKEIILRLHAEAVGRAYGGDDICSHYSSAGGWDGVSQFSATVEDMELGPLELFYTLGRLKRTVKQKVYDLKPKELDTSQLQIKRKVHHKNVFNAQHFADAFWGKAFVSKDHLPGYTSRSFAVHACKNGKSIDRARNLIPGTDEAKELIVTALVNERLRDDKLQVKNQMLEETEALYLRCLHKTHEGFVMPLTWSEICEWLEDNDREPVSKEQVGYNEETGLCYKACMRVGCRHYLVPSKSLPDHLDPLRTDLVIVWAFHRTIRLNRRKELEAIRQLCIEGAHMIYGKKRSDKHFEKHHERLMAEMKAVRDKYLSMFG